LCSSHVFILCSFRCIVSDTLVEILNFATSGQGGCGITLIFFVLDCGWRWVTRLYIVIRQQQRMRNICWRKSNDDWVVSAKPRWKNGGLICLSVISLPATGCTNMPSRFLSVVFHVSRSPICFGCVVRSMLFPSVLWDCSLSDKKGVQPVKNPCHLSRRFCSGTGSGEADNPKFTWKWLLKWRWCSTWWIVNVFVFYILDQQPLHFNIQ